MEAVSEAGDGSAWFQPCPSSNHRIMALFVERVEGAGFDVLVETVDVPALRWRERNVANGYLSQLDGEKRVRRMNEILRGTST